MAENDLSSIAKLVSDHEKEIVAEWLGLLKVAGSLQTGRITESELQSQSRAFLHLLKDALGKAGTDATNPAYTPAREMLADLSRTRALQGFSPSETATFVFSLKQPLFDALNRSTASRGCGGRTDLVGHPASRRTRLYTLEIFQKSREEIIPASSARSPSCRPRSSSCGTASSRCR